MEFTEEQKRVIECRDKNILVSAAAGAGKTAVLTERIIGRILDKDDPVDIDRILTVTFTNAAASEMKERIRKRLLDLVFEDPSNERIRTQLNLIHNASIMTIDAFSSRVIKDNFELINLDPSFRVGDANEVSLLSDEALSEVLDEEYELGSKDFLEFIESCSPGKEDKDISEYITKLSKAADSRPDREEWLKSLISPYEKAAEGEFENEPWVEALMDITDNVLKSIKRSYEEAVRLSLSPGGPYHYEEILKVEETKVSSLISERTYKGRYELFRNLDFDRLPSKRDDSIDTALRETVKEMRGSLKSRLQKVGQKFFNRTPEEAAKTMALGFTPVSELIRLTLRYRERFAEKKDDRNILDFSDIEEKALKILKLGAADIYRDYYKEVMTDEYQDSNSLQEEILNSIATDRDRFSVGDVKQSIYGFRLAEPGIFMKKYFDYYKDEKSERILLNKNFRSRKAVIDSINSIFKHIMHRETGGVEYDSEHELNFGASYSEDRLDNRSELILIDKDEEGELEGIEEEALYMASRIRDMKESFLVTDKGTGDLRKAEYSDFAILLRSVSGVDDKIRDILISAGIPAVTENSTGYFKTKEIRLILNILSIIDNPRQDIPLVAVLKSPIGGFSMEELSILRVAHPEGCFYDCLTEGEVNDELRKKCDSFLKWLKSYRDILNVTPLSNLIRMITDDERGIFLFLNGKEKDNISLLIRRAADFEKMSSKGLFRFLRYVEKIKKLDLDLTEAAGEGSSNAVRILSIHKSKGLEFPVVFIGNMNKKFNMMDTTGSLITHKDLGLGLKYIDSKRRVKLNPVLREVISEKIRKDTIGEELRILYVAMTRAKEKLIMTASVKEPDKLFSKIYDVDSALSYLDLIMTAYKEDEEGFSEYTDIFTSDTKSLTMEAAAEAVSGLEIKEEILKARSEKNDLSSMIEKSLKWEYPFKDSVSTPLKVSVSELKKEDYEKALLEENTAPVFDAVKLITGEADEDRAGEKEDKKRMEEASKKGTAFHKALSLIDTDILPGEGAADKALEILTEKGSLKESERELIDPADLDAFLRTPIWKRMCDADKRNELFREQPFIIGRKASEIFPDITSDETVQIQGIIDVFFIEDNKITILDYKTDRVRDGEALVKRYKKQLDIYGDALKQILTLETGEKVIYSTALKKEIRL